MARPLSVNDEQIGTEDHGKQVFLVTTAPRFTPETRIHLVARFVHFNVFLHLSRVLHKIAKHV